MSYTPETVVDALVTVLTNGMAAKVAALNIEYTDDIVLVVMKAYYVAEQSAIPEYPVITILAERGTPADFAGDWDWKLRVIVVATDQDPTTLRRMLSRYIRAICEILAASAAQPMSFDGIDYSPMFGRAGTFLSDASVQITA